MWRTRELPQVDLLLRTDNSPDFWHLIMQPFTAVCKKQDAAPVCKEQVCLWMFVQTAQVAIVHVFVGVDSSNSFSSGYFDVWPTLAVAQYKAIYLVCSVCVCVKLFVWQWRVWKCVDAAGVSPTSALVFFLFSYSIFTIFFSFLLLTSTSRDVPISSVSLWHSDAKLCYGSQLWLHKSC